MNLSTIPLPRFLNPKKRNGFPGTERAEGIYLQESFLYSGPQGLQNAFTHDQAQILAADILAEMTCTGCKLSSAGRTAFIP
jgi:hypothetical protein